MPVKFISNQSPETKPPQLIFKISLLNLVTIVIIINVVIGGYSGEDLIKMIGSCNCPITVV